MNRHKKIANLVIKHTGVDIYSKRKTQDVVDARGLFEYIMREDYLVTYQSISDHYRKNGKHRAHCVIMYSVKNFDREIRDRRNDLNDYYNTILQTEITAKQYKNAQKQIGSIKTQRDYNKIRWYMNRVLQTPDKV
jgi:chromosomal replication initiation ATPase DnaA